MKYIIISILLSGQFLATGQTKKDTLNKKWGYSISVGLSGLGVNGIPVSQAHQKEALLILSIHYT